MLSRADAPFWPGNQWTQFYGFISGVTNLSCEAVAEPPANFTWLDKHNQVVDPKKVFVDGHKSILRVRIIEDFLATIACPRQ